MNYRLFSAVVAVSIFCFLGSPVCAQSNNSLSMEELAEDWKLLFDGSSMKHWRMYNGETMPDALEVRDGTMTFDPAKADGAEGGRSII